MPLSKDIEFLQAYCNAGCEAVLQEGYHWFQERLTPTLQAVSKELTDPILLGEAWLVAGEVHELLFAPLQAVTCYQLALHFDPKSSDIYRWLALVQEQLGDYLDAMKNIELALKYTDEGSVLMEDRQRIQDCIVYDKIPDFQESDLTWKYNELLAEGKPAKILKELEEVPNIPIELLKCLYRAYGLKNDKKAGEEVWKQIQTLESAATLEALDLFYWK